MSKTSDSRAVDFVDYNSFEHISSRSDSTRSSIIKSTSVKEKGIAKIEVISGNETEPSIYIHRQDEKISKIEFICSCGKSTHLDLEYEDE